MESLFKYSLSVSIPLIILWASYHWSLSKGNCFRANRITIFIIYAASLTMMPLISYFNFSPFQIPDVAPTTANGATSDESFDWFHLFSVIWSIGAGIIFVATMAELLRIQVIKRKCQIVSHNGQTIFLSDNPDLLPFSFGNIIVMNRMDFQENADTIILHETAHKICCHSVDLLLSQIVATLCWYNPASWLLTRDLKTLHEYQADDYVSKSGSDLKHYQMFLIGRASGTKFPHIANNLNYSQISNRISMMNHKEEEGSRSSVRFALPFIGLIMAITIVAFPPVRSVVSPDIQASSSSKESDLEKINIYVEGEKVSMEDLQDLPKSEIKAITVSKKDNRVDIEMKENYKSK